MVINAIILGVSSIHVRWKNKRYEQSRWLLFVAMLGFALQFFVQMAGGFRAAGADMGALINTLFYPPFFTCMALGIYNIEVPQAASVRCSSSVAVYMPLSSPPLL